MRIWILVLAMVCVSAWAVSASADPESVGQKSSEARLLDILLERNIITAEEYQELSNLTADSNPTNEIRRSDFASSVENLVQMQGGGTEARTSYDKGFEMATGDGMFSLKIGGRLQARYTYSDVDSDQRDLTDDELDLVDSYGLPGFRSDNSSFAVQRARVILQGHAFDPNVRYMFQLDFAEDTDNGNTALKDGYIEWSNPEYFYNVRAGQYKAPFGRQELTSSGNLQLVDRSLVSDYFTPGREVGVMVHGQTEGGFFEYAGGLFNGDGEDQNVNDTNAVMGVARIAFNPMGEFPLYEGDVKYTEDLGVSIGADYLYNPMGSMSGGSYFPTDVKANMNSFGIDGQLRFMGLSLIGEYFWREISEESSGVNYDDIKDNGFYLQGGFFVVPETIELAARYGWFNNKDDNTDTDNDISEITVGLNYYFKEHNHKLQLDYSYQEVDPDGGDKLKDNIIRLQWQLKF